MRAVLDHPSCFLWRTECETGDVRRGGYVRRPHATFLFSPVEHGVRDGGCAWRGWIYVLSPRRWRGLGAREMCGGTDVCTFVAPTLFDLLLEWRGGCIRGEGDLVPSRFRDTRMDICAFLLLHMRSYGAYRAPLRLLRSLAFIDFSPFIYPSLSCLLSRYGVATPTDVPTWPISALPAGRACPCTPGAVPAFSHAPSPFARKILNSSLACE
jgi:hypothetical protein